MIGERLKQLREEQNLSQSELSEQIGIAQSSIGNYERGNRFPDSQIILKISEFFNVSADYLLGLSKYKNPEEKTNIAKEFTEISSKINALPPDMQKKIASICRTVILCYDSLSGYDNSLDKFFVSELHKIVDLLKVCCNNASLTQKGIFYSWDKSIMQQGMFSSVKDEQSEEIIIDIIEKSFEYEKKACDILEGITHKIKVSILRELNQKEGEKP
jgi:transcriptional regulator with XRE-family HTH domain